MKISIIAALAKNNVIGKNNEMPWHMPADLAHFKQLTLYKPVIMGRKTYESIGKALPNRENIVITSSYDFQAPNCKIAHNLEEAIKQTTADEIMIIGGASLYQQALPYATHLYLTFIDAEFKGDTFFPKIDSHDWKETDREKHLADTQNPYNYSFVTLKRR